MKLGIALYSGQGEVIWNALRFANFALAAGDSVRVFLMGEGVEIESLSTQKFNISEQLKTYLETGGQILACGTCLQIHQVKPSAIFSVATMKDLYEITKESDRLVTF